MKMRQRNFQKGKNLKYKRAKPYFGLWIRDAFHNKVDQNFAVLLEKLSECLELSSYDIHVLLFDAEDPVLIGVTAEEQNSLIQAVPRGIVFTYSQVLNAVCNTIVGECVMVFLSKGCDIFDRSSFVLRCADSCIWSIQSSDRELLQNFADRFEDTEMSEIEMERFYREHFS